MKKGSMIKTSLSENYTVYMSAHTPEINVPTIRYDLLSIELRKGKFELLNEDRTKVACLRNSVGRISFSYPSYMY